MSDEDEWQMSEEEDDFQSDAGEEFVLEDDGEDDDSAFDDMASDASEIESESDFEPVVKKGKKKTKAKAKPKAKAKSKAAPKANNKTKASPKTTKSKAKGAERKSPPPAKSSHTAKKRPVSSKAETAAPAKKAKGGAKKVKKEVKKATGDTAVSLVYEYLKAQNRPYSHTQVFDNLHGRVGKTGVPKILEALAKEGKITKKVFGKAKIFTIIQSIFPVQSPEEIEKMDEEIKAQKARDKELDGEVSALTSVVRQMTSTPTDAELDAKLESLTEQTQKQQAKLDSLQSGQALLGEAEVANIQKEFNRCFKEWKKRRKGCDEMIKEYLDNAPKKIKYAKFVEDIGVETDEEYKVDIKDYEDMYIR